MATSKSEPAKNTDCWEGVLAGAEGNVRVAVEVTDKGLSRLNLVEFGTSSAPTRPPVHPLLEKVVGQLREYFAGERQVFDLPLDLSGTPFQNRVWKAAARIPYGQTRSYWWMAVRLGDPHVARAVGGALGANPVPLVIPCHRVVKKDDSLGGFSCGLDWKVMLIAHEKAVAGAGRGVRP